MKTMEEVLAAHPAPKTAAECKAAIAALLAEMEHLNDLMAKDRAEIERLENSLDARIADIQARLNSLSVSRQANVEATG